MSLVPFDPKSEGSVLTLLEVAATWLAEAVHRGEPGEVALVKAQLATAAEATKQLNLSKDIQLDAQEMVRRAEYALGKAIRRGQEEGTMAVRGSFGAGRSASEADLKRPTDFASDAELHGNPTKNAPGILALVDAAPEPADFDAALSQAKAEGNLSRANVARKSRGGAPLPTSHISRESKADQIAQLAAQGYSSRQMPSRVGIAEDTIRNIAREYDIDIPADRSIARTRRINSTDVVVNTATALEGLVSGVELVEYGDVDPAVASQWVDSLSESMRALNRFVRQIKEQTQ